jgi:hypothetical protein
MTSTYCWYEPYKTALLETDATKIRERIQTAEAKIQDRQRVLAEDHGGTPEERQAIADAMNGLKALLKESAEWPRPHVPDGGPPTSD